MPLAADPAHDGAVLDVNMHLEAKAGDPQDKEVTGDDSMVAAEILAAPPKDHLVLEGMDLHPELAPLVRRQPDDARRLPHQSLFYHRP